MTAMKRDAESLVREYARIAKSIAPKLERMDEIKESLSLLLPQGRSESKVADVTLTENVTYPFDKSLLTPSQRRRVMKEVVDTKKWASLFPADHEACKTPGDKKFKVGIKIH